ncbi:uncharacterized protein METZ01_LOCUS173128 [marine metagenome]|uniref:Uncharacterized protein n=1 Tax=marine metagenome TaxID=408172 RepID=A0A382C311_9ZZZZ
MTRNGYKYNPIFNPVTTVNRITISATMAQYRLIVF